MSVHSPSFYPAAPAAPFAVRSRRALLAGVSMAALASLAAAPAAAQTSYTGPNGGVWSTGTNWTAGTPNGGVATTVDNGATVVTDGNDAAGSLTIGPAAGSGVDVQTGTALAIGGPVSNSGQIGLNGALELTGDVTLSGSGALTMTGPTNPGNTGQIGTDGNGRTLTNQSTIQGSGLIGSNAVTYSNLFLNNSGLIDGNSTANALEIGGNGGSIVNSGTFKASAGGGLILATQAPVNNAGGLILADGAGSTVTVATSIQGGTLATSNTGVLQTGTGGATLDGSTQGAITLKDGSTYTATAGLTSIAGTLNLGTSTGATLALGGQLRLVGDTTLSGTGGVVNISGDPAAQTGGQIGTDGNGRTLTNNVTIQGSGLIGSNAGALYQNLFLANTGTINANTSGATLTVAGSGGSIVNAGLLTATAGGTLNLATGAPVNNQAGTITAAAGSTVNVSNTTIQGGTLTTSGGGVMQTVGSSLLDGATLGGITLADKSTYTAMAGLTSIAGSLNLGTSTGSTLALGGQLRLVGDTTLSGPGVVNISGDPSGPIGGQIGTDGNGRTLTNNVTIQGSGLIGSNAGALYQNLFLANNGTIDANTSGKVLAIQGSGGLIVNAGRFQATGGGLLNLATQAPVDNTAGTILADGSGSAVTVATTVRGGKLTTTRGGVIQTAAGGATLDASGPGGITLTDGSTYTSTAGLTSIVGTLNLGTSKGATLTLGNQLRLVGDTTLTGPGGVVNISGDPSGPTGGQIGTDGNGRTLTNNVTIQGSGLIGSNAGALYQNLFLANTGTIDANTSGATLTVAGSGGLIVNAGLLTATAGGTLNLATGAPINNQAGVITAAAGSTVNVSNTTIQGGTLNTSGGGVMQTVGSSLLDGFNQGAITISDGSTYTSGASAFTRVAGTLNLGTVTGGALALSGQMQLVGDTTLAGPGSITLSGAGQIGTDGNGRTLTNDATIQGSGLIGSNAGALSQNLGLANNGLILASGGLLTVQGTNGITNGGTLQAGAGATLAVTSPLTNYASGTLSGGTYRADAGGALTLNTGAIATNAATIVLNGAGSTLTTGAGLIETQITANAAGGTLSVLGGRSYVTANAVANSGAVNLGGGTFTAAPLTNLAGGTVTGFGTVANADLSPLSNAGSVTASGGALVLANGASGATGTLASNAGATLDLSRSAVASSAGTLANGGALALGGQSIVVSSDYTNAGFGVGNAFNSHAGVTGSGLILASGDTKLVVSGAGITGGGSTLALGNFHTTGAGSGSFTIANGGTTGPVLRGAVQTSGLTNPALGLTASNFGPLAAGASTTETLSFTSAAAGVLTGQSFKVVTNFDNVAAQTIGVTGTAYRLAAANAIAPLAFGNVHQGDTVQGALSLTNTAVADGFSEKLDATFGSATDARITSSGSVALLAAGATDNTSLKVGINTASTGSVNGSVHVNLASDGAGTSGLGVTALPGQDVGVSATIATSGSVYGLAQASLHTPEPVGFGAVRIGSAQSQALTISNTAPNDGFHEKLDAQIGSATGAATAAGAFSLLAAQQTDSASLKVGLDTSAAGVRAGTATIALQSDGTGTSGLGLTNLAPQTVNVSGTVYRLASPAAIAPVTVAARVGDAAPSAGAALTNVSPDAYTEGLKASLGGATGPFTAGGSIASLAAGQTDGASLKVGVSTATSGVFTGSATATLASTGAGTDGATDLALTPQTVSLTGKVYATAVASVTPSAAFGIVHVGDAVAAQVVNVSNTATGALTDTLRGGFATVGGPFVGTGSLADVAAGHSGTLSVGLSTATAGVYAASASLALSSHDPDLADASVAGGPVSLSATVNNYAKAAFLQTGGAGAFTGSATSYTLNFGTLTQGTAAQTADLALTNAVTGPADVLSGAFTPAAPDYAFSGLSAFADLMAGGLHAVDVTLATTTLGMFDETLTFDGTGSNASGYTGPDQRITLTLEGDVVASGGGGGGGGGSSVPEPGTLAVLAGAALGLLGLRRRAA